MNHPKIVLLGGKGISTHIIFNALHPQFNLAHAIIEQPESKKKFLQRRLKKLGFATVLGQVLFQVIIVPFLNIAYKKRKSQILEQNNLLTNPIPAHKITNVTSVNALETIQLLQKIQPDLIIVNGTRIISKKVLKSLTCKFINTHAGITPQYRGVHGGYWALANHNDLQNCGVTVHFVDAGIDTGNIIHQALISPTSHDSFVTYPLLQLAEGIILLQKTIYQYFNNTLATQSKPHTTPSQLWYHPTIFQYLYYFFTKKIK